MTARTAAIVTGLATLLLAPASAVGVPSLSDPTVAPTTWSASATAALIWIQNDFVGVEGPALVQVNAATDGSATGTWTTLATIPGPLASGSNGVLALPVGGLDGRHRARVVVEGVLGSPLTLGVLQLDRTPPAVSSVKLTPAGGTVTADWVHSDAASGTDPEAPVVVEVNTAADGSDSGSWVPFAQQPEPGEGRKLATTSLAGLADGPHLVRVRSRDRVGNEGAPVLGTTIADGTAPSVTARVARAATVPGQNVELAFTAVDPTPGGGVAGTPPARVGPPGGGEDWTATSPSNPGRIWVRLPGPGLHRVTVRVRDRAGNEGESAPVLIRMPTPDQASDWRVGPRPAPAARAGQAPPAAVRRAYLASRRFHASRGVRLRAGLRVGRTARAWRDVVGNATARDYSGFTSYGGTIFLGPAATRGLELLDGARRRPRSRADADRIAMGLAVLLHETLHATGPSAAADVASSRSGRAFEEGFAEAVTADLLGSFAASLGLAEPLARRVRAAVGRYQNAYRPQVVWVRKLSARATRSAMGSARARAWRIRVADTWGTGRWSRLAEATGLSAEELRAGVPAPPEL